MKAKLVICVSSFLILLLGTGIVITAEEANNKRIIVGYEEAINLQDLKGIPYELHHIMDSINAVSITIPSNRLQQIKEISGVRWVENDYVVTTESEVVDWGYKETITTGTKKLGLTGKGIKVGIIDTGINGKHPDLNVVGGESFVEEEPNFQDLNGHGTHVAGIIAAKNNMIGTVGVAPNVNIYAIKALNQYGKGRQTDIIAGIEWAVEHDLDIVNLSLTSPHSTIALKLAIESADDAGLLIVAASGNDETGLGQVGKDIMYPARYPDVIGVGSIGRDLKKSSFSYGGSSLSYTAPGENIYSTYVLLGSGENDYNNLSGTSMAAPYVAGVFALYKQAYPYMNTNQIKAKVSENVIDLGREGKDPDYGYGLVQSPALYFSDTKPDVWYSDSVQSLAKKEYVSGYQDGTFRPANSITREEAVTMIGTILNLNGTQRDSIYSDVKKEYFGSGFIVSATNEQIITGYPDDTFRPKSFISRGDVAVMVQKAFDIPLSEEQAFDDVKKGKYYFNEVNALFNSNILSGYPDNRFKPEQNISRAEFSVILSKTLKEY
ncbi:S8 family serine peptidase [Virgibacillus necropolis]|uniref:S8 family peptidase n=1 Tax=Virgibacillus necropolis TaxID=163877 RepID=UPI00384C39DF